MAEINKDTIKEVSKPKIEDTEYVYVTIPAEDLYDNVHPGVRINRQKFEAGKTYSVPAPVAAEVEDRLEKFRREEIRLLRPKTDQRSVNQVNAGSLWKSQGGAVQSLEGGLESLGGPNEKVIVVKW